MTTHEQVTQDLKTEIFEEMKISAIFAKNHAVAYHHMKTLPVYVWSPDSMRTAALGYRWWWMTAHNPSNHTEAREGFEKFKEMYFNKYVKPKLDGLPMLQDTIRDDLQKLRTSKYSASLYKTAESNPLVIEALSISTVNVQDTRTAAHVARVLRAAFNWICDASDADLEAQAQAPQPPIQLSLLGSA